MDLPIQTFEPNNKGRDFVIGDLHGSLSCFNNLVKNLNFDRTKDRMFSVGDLVDRGPDSLGCMRLLLEDWFHCVLSNHEQMMYEAFNGGYMGAYWFQNGGTWGIETYNVAKALQAKEQGRSVEMPVINDEDTELIDLLALIGKLPFLITINHKSGKKFHVIHAELPQGIEINDDVLSHPEKVLDLATRQTRDGDVFLWGRYKFGEFYKTDLGNRAKIIRVINNQNLVGDVCGFPQFDKKLSHIISGHTIMQNAMTLVGQTNIDTGAYYAYPERDQTGYEKVKKWAGLTCICLDDWKFYKATPIDFKEVEPFTINRIDIVS